MLVKSEILATVWEIKVSEGDEVEAGSLLLILESMKMEIPVTAPAGARVVSVLVEQGQTVVEGDRLVELS
jgi:acetyl-CoA carboxylase biotin carboxyl carrier protein